MNQIESYTEEQTLAALADVNQTLDGISASWKEYRQQSKELTLRLVTVHGYSMARAAALSEHHRNTVKVWLDLHNAENKAGKRK